MKKTSIKNFIIAFAFVFTTTAFASASNLPDEDFYVTDDTTVEEILMYVNPIEYSQYPESVKEEFRTMNFSDITQSEEEDEIDKETRSADITLRITSDLEAKGLGTIVFSATFNSNHGLTTMPYLSLNSVLTDPNGKVLKSATESDFNTKSVTVSETVGGITPLKGEYTLTNVGYANFPSGYYPPNATLTSKKTINPGLLPGWG